MKPEFIGEVSRSGVTFSMEEADSNGHESSDEFTVIVHLTSSRASLDLNALRLMKKHIAEAERRLVHRHDVAMRRRNLSLDFS